MSTQKSTLSDEHPHKRQYTENYIGGGSNLLGDLHGNFNINVGEGQFDYPEELLGVSRPQDDSDSIMNKKGNLISGACQWIDEEFKSFRASNSCCMWIHGPPGTGKTMTAVYLARKIDRMPAESLKMAFIGHFLCSIDDSKSSTIISMFKSLVKQVLDYESLQDEVKFNIRRDYHRRIKSHGPNVFKTKESILSLLRQLLSRIPGRKMIILDALDECESKPLYKVLQNLLMDQSYKDIRWIFTSRDGPNVLAIEPGIRSTIHNVNLSEERFEIRITECVQIYITSRLRSLDGEKLKIATHRLPPNLPGSAEHRLQDKLTCDARGNFLWASLKIDQLEEDPYGFDLESVGVLEFYNRLLQNILKPSTESISQHTQKAELSRNIAIRQMLSILSTVFRPLTMIELAAIMRVPYIRSIEKSLSYVPDFLTINTLMSRCKLLLEIRGQSIHLVHLSLREHLQRQADAKAFPFNDEGGFEFTDPHRIIMNVLIACLQNPSSSKKSTEADIVSESNQSVLKQYANDHWLLHARGIRDISNKDVRSLADFAFPLWYNMDGFLAPETKSVILLKARDSLGGEIIIPPNITVNITLNPLLERRFSWRVLPLNLPTIQQELDVIAAILGLHGFFRIGTMGFIPKPQEFRTLIMIAAANGYLDMLKTLLSYDAVQNCRADLRDFTAIISVICGQEDILNHVHRPQLKFPREIILIAAYHGFADTVNFLINDSPTEHFLPANFVYVSTSDITILKVENNESESEMLYELHCVSLGLNPDRDQFELTSFTSNETSRFSNLLEKTTLVPPMFPEIVQSRINISFQQWFGPQEPGEQTPSISASSIIDPSSLGVGSIEHSWHDDSSINVDRMLAHTHIIELFDSCPDKYMASLKRTDPVASVEALTHFLARYVQMKRDFNARRYPSSSLDGSKPRATLPDFILSVYELLDLNELYDFLNSPLYDTSLQEPVEDELAYQKVLLTKVHPDRRPSRLGIRIIASSYAKITLDIPVNYDRDTCKHKISTPRSAWITGRFLSPLSIAARESHINTIEALFEAGMPIDAPDTLLCLCESLQLGNYDVVQKLLERSVNLGAASDLLIHLVNDRSEGTDNITKQDVARARRLIRLVGMYGMLYELALKGDLWMASLLLQYSTSKSVKDNWNRALQRSYLDAEARSWRRDVGVTMALERIASRFLDLPEGWVAHRAATDFLDYYENINIEVPYTQYQHPGVPVRDGELSMDDFWGERGKRPPASDHIAEAEYHPEIRSDCSDLEFSSTSSVSS